MPSEDTKILEFNQYCKYDKTPFIIYADLEYLIAKEIPIVFHNGCNYDYHFMIKELAKEFKGQFNCLGENCEKYIIFPVPIEKEVTRINKMEKKLQKVYLAQYNLLTVQDLWQAHCQILLIILLKEFIKLDVQTVVHAVVHA